MTALLVALVLAAPCPEPVAVVEGVPSPCSGVAMSGDDAQRLGRAVVDLRLCERLRVVDANATARRAAIDAARIAELEGLAAQPVVVTREADHWTLARVVAVVAGGALAVVGVVQLARDDGSGWLAAVGGGSGLALGAAVDW